LLQLKGNLFWPSSNRLVTFRLEGIDKFCSRTGRPPLLDASLPI
jgi:hypothetical protein